MTALFQMYNPLKMRHSVKTTCLYGVTPSCHVSVAPATILLLNQCNQCKKQHPIATSVLTTPWHPLVFKVGWFGPDGQKGSTMNSMATCLTWRGMGSIRLYFALDARRDENQWPYHTGSVAAQVNEERDLRCTPRWRCQACSCKLQWFSSYTFIINGLFLNHWLTDLVVRGWQNNSSHDPVGNTDLSAATSWTIALMAPSVT